MLFILKVMNNNIDLIIKLAWHDKSSFQPKKQKIFRLYAWFLKRGNILIMRKNLKPSSFKIWRKRVSGRKSKHEKKFKLLDKKNNSYESI